MTTYMPAVQNLPDTVPALTQGANQAGSKHNLIEWLDAIVENCCKASRRVHDENNRIVPGSYDHIQEYTLIISKLTNLPTWTTEIIDAGEFGEGGSKPRWRCGKLHPNIHEIGTFQWIIAIMFVSNGLLP